MVRQIFKAENAKIRHSFLLYLHIAVLFLFPILLGLYYGSRKLTVAPASMITTFYEILAMATPIMISIVICLVFDREEKAGEFKNWLTEPFGKAKMIQGQLNYYWLWYVIEIIGISLIYYFLLVAIYHVSNISFLKLIATSIVFAFCGLAQYELTQIVALKWGIGGSLVMGFFGTVISLLSITSLLDIVWPIIPWAWQIRTITFWQANISGGLINFVALEYVCPLIMTVIIIFLGKNYFDKWEGK